MNLGFVDTNVFIHAQANDEHSEECRAFLRALQRGHLEARLDVLVLHELAYALPRYRREMSRQDVANFMLSVLAWDGIIADRPLLSDAISRWSENQRFGFVDAYLAAMAAADEVPVYTKNIRDFDGQGVEAPDPLPGVPR